MGGDRAGGFSAHMGAALEPNTKAGEPAQNTHHVRRLCKIVPRGTVLHDRKIPCGDHGARSPILSRTDERDTEIDRGFLARLFPAFRG